MEGRGLYTGARAWGLYAEYDQNGGFNWGYQAQIAAVYDFDHPSDVDRDKLQKAYEMQQEYPDEEVFFSDVDDPSLMIKDASGHYVPNYSDDASVWGHTHDPSNPMAKLDPSNIDNILAFENPDKRHIMINGNGIVKEYKGVENPYFNDVTGAHTPPSPIVINSWPISARKGWSIEYRHGRFNQWNGWKNRYTGKVY